MENFRNYATAIYSWLSGFAPTFREPIIFDADKPQPNEYISYSATASGFAQQFIQPLTIYSKSTGFTRLMEIADAIGTAIGDGGIVLHNEWGHIAIYKGSPFVQDKPDETEEVRACYMNLLITIYNKE